MKLIQNIKDFFKEDTIETEEMKEILDILFKETGKMLINKESMGIRLSIEQAKYWIEKYDKTKITNTK